VPGERTWLVPSLSLSDVREEMDPGQLARHESVRLFVERAKAAAPPFGIAWYEGDIETNVQGYGKGFFVGRFNRETFAMDPDSVMRRSITAMVLTLMPRPTRISPPSTPTIWGCSSTRPGPPGGPVVPLT